MKSVMTIYFVFMSVCLGKAQNAHDYLNQITQTYNDCAITADKIDDEISLLDMNYSVQIKEIRAGHICSKCHRPKSVIEKAEGIPFGAHLTKVNGIAIKATLEDIRDAEKKITNKYDSDKNRLEQRYLDHESDCDERINIIVDRQKRYKDQQLLNNVRELNSLVQDITFISYRDGYNQLRNFGDRMYRTSLGGKITNQTKSKSSISDMYDDFALNISMDDLVIEDNGIYIARWI